MGVPKQIQKIFSIFKGLDRRSSDFVRSQEFASELENGRIRSDGALIKRPGYSLISGNADTYGGSGIYTWTNIDKTTNAITEKVITLDADLRVLEESSFILRYLDAATDKASVYYSVNVEDNKRNLNLIIDYDDEDKETIEKNFDLGTGYLLTDLTLTQLNVLLGLYRISIVLPSDIAGSSLAAHMDTDANVLLDRTTGDATVPYFVSTKPTHMGDVSFSTHKGKRNVSTFENASFANINGNLYIATGYEELMKFDGLRVYRAGLPKPTDIDSTVAGTESASGTFGADKYELTRVSGVAYIEADQENWEDRDPLLVSEGNPIVGAYAGGGTTVTITGNTTDTSVTIDTISTEDIAKLQTGGVISGSGIPVNISIREIYTNSIRLSEAATATGTGVTLTFKSATVACYTKTDHISTGTTKARTDVDNVIVEPGEITDYDGWGTQRDIKEGTQVNLIYFGSQWFPVEGANPEYLQVGEYINLNMRDFYDSSWFFRERHWSSLSAASYKILDIKDSEYASIKYVRLDGTFNESNAFYGGESIRSFGTSTHKYMYTYVHKDNQGQIIESVPSEYSPTITFNPSVEDNELDHITITIPYMTQEAHPNFNTASAILSSIDVTKKILTMGDASQLIEGDIITVYDADNATPQWVDRTITNIATNDVTIDEALSGQTKDTTNGREKISAGMRIRIYRTYNTWVQNSQLEDPLPDFFFLEEVANSSAGGNLEYVDTTTDDDILANGAYTQPIKEHGLPPKGRYITAWNKQLIVAGRSDAVNTVYYSDYESPEYFPSWTNSLIINTKLGDKITGLAPLANVLYIFQGKSIHTLMGDLINDAFKLSLLSTAGEIGCAAHHTITEIHSNLFFLSDSGVFRLQKGAGAAVEVSARVSPLFKPLDFAMKRAVAVNWIKENLFVIYIPKETTSGLGTDESIILTYDHYRDAWMQWTNLDFGGGLTIKDGNVVFTERGLSNTTTGMLGNKKDSSDFNDNHGPIPFKYSTHWEAVGEPSINKKFLRVKLHALDPQDVFETPNFSLDVKVAKNYVPENIASLNLEYLSSEGWGLEPWGNSRWGDYTRTALKHKLPTGWSKSFRLSFENNNINENVLISGYELEIASPVRPEIKD